jgi:sugar/nucleoside kinase (ribokinase family)
MYMGGGEDLACLLRRAKRAGLTTALDMAYPDPAREAGHVDWLHLLELVLPLVDIFVPSLDETSIMLRAPLPRDATDPAGAPLMAAHVHMLAERLLDLGAGMVGIKAGDRGFYLRTGTRERLRVGGPGMPADAAGWALRELWSPVFQVDVVSTVGSGDATVAGFLFGVLGGMGPEEAATAACAVGACSVEAADATSGVRTWDETSARLAHGWPRHHLCLGSRWRELPSLGLWAGPSDCGSGAA